MSAKEKREDCVHYIETVTTFGADVYALVLCELYTKCVFCYYDCEKMKSKSGKLWRKK